MVNIDVSVIVPVYNGEKYLKKCLDSLNKQTLETIEIICINDGSTDKSLEILNDYAKKDSRIKVISKENGGAGSARNVGLENVNGKYVAFVDADDWVDSDIFEKLYNLSESKNTDIIIFKMLDYDEKNDEFYKSDYYKIKPLNEFNNKLFKIKDIENSLFKITTSTANKFYNTEFLKKSGTRFPEGFIFEDNPFFFDLMLKADKIFLLDEYVYYRRRRESSVMSSINDSYYGIIPIIDIITNVFRKNNAYDRFKKDLLNFNVLTTRNKYNLMDDKYKKKFFWIMKEYFSNISKDTQSNKDFKDNLNKKNLNFYLIILKSSNYLEFKLLKENYELRTKNKRLINKNKKLNNENKKIKEEIKELYSSNSWKLTKPIRIIGKIFK
ncbi:glycosyltransferase family 2 protein [Methanobrevibacter arboriphilus]|uniref:Glycosyl transferase n=1 Tax=Methanobrevibacter arboriphilus TaxID=39441 RepID=A0ACA8R3M4_METAZ|nr:glycosyltransferase [Methanobrevibacter arboriphilus]BBL62217.1 glycosyl transferase [Methanobrevibacter arboriphilus]